MNIDLTNLITNIEEEISIDINVNYNEEKLKTTNIRKLIDTKFNGIITKLYNDEYKITGTISGTMILPDDITLEDTDYKFNSNIEEKFSNNDDNLKIIQNKLDISEFLWQNILVEIPMKVINSKNENITLEGNGWRLITEEELHKNNNNSPFDGLLDKFTKERSDD